MSVRRHAADPLYRTAYSLMAATVVTAMLGVVFWAVAARLYPPEVVGRDAALISSMIALASVSNLNLNSAISRFLPQMGSRTARVVIAAYAAGAATAVVLAAVFVLVVPRWVDDLRPFQGNWLLSLTFVVALVAWTVFLLQDAALSAVRAAHWVPVENGAFAILKIAALPLMLVLVSDHGIFVSWLLPVVLVIPPVNWLMFRRAIPRHVAAQTASARSTDEFTRRRLLAFLSQDYLGAIISQVAFMLLPLLVVAMLGSRENAYFNVALTLVTSFDLLFLNAVTAFTVEGAMSRARVDALMRALVRNLFAPLVAASALLILVAPLVLMPFGGDYAREAAPVVRILACASIFRACLYLYSSLRRLEGRAWPIVRLQAGLSVLLLGLTILLAEELGLIGVALAWLIAHVVVFLAALPGLVRAVRRPAARLDDGDGDNAPAQPTVSEVRRP